MDGSEVKLWWLLCSNREKDGLWAVLAWLSILAYRNGAKKENLGDKLAKIAPGISRQPPTSLSTC